ncbi:MAG: zinc dependent phospholipase C family protein [bacterium]|nr:zinc dependent phospholipase C family protein [bacterium]
MPGIVTHNKILKETVKSLSKKGNKSYLSRSIISLFNSDEYLQAGLFGALGPNIFDYIPRRNKKFYYGHEISFFLHNGGSKELLSSMINRVYDYEDKNNEWAAAQRAYLYGFISHIIADSFFHPFVFYWSGFPDTFSKKEIYYYREQNLLFQYNIDNYFLYYDRKDENFHFSIDEMLPLKKRYGIEQLVHPVRTMIADSLKEVHPELHKKITWFKNRNNRENPYPGFGSLDLIPFMIKLSYRVKNSKNKRLVNFIDELRRRDLIYSDFIVRYRERKKYNEHVLNFHKEPWRYPAEQKGYRYESVGTLVELTCEKTAEVWEKIEASLFGEKNPDVIADIMINAFTGEERAGYSDLKIKSPVKMY